MSLIDASTILQDYHVSLEALRQKTGRLKNLPPVSFFLFGMGPRRKLIYEAVRLRDARTGEILQQWDVTSERIVPPAYTVQLQTSTGREIQIIEDEAGIWLEEGSRRDGAMMGMVLRQTGNLDLIRDWILSLRDPYDRNNAGETEADNLGQALYLISLVSDSLHPLAAAVLEQFPKFQKGNYIQGRSDFAEHSDLRNHCENHLARGLNLASLIA